eukprot:gnl/TRDRNA2_/TRDRNA2_116770_c0_seq2.p1 gnl/TRDRNA2_/TRDRNA2_116770_c0~~gnl/TRDRNA2_/TRDRNA2_116770_c0_seq2.p1  ORF type:complete len:191 (+),score=21.13 gnl/TRDRNA2_/TRDRNA2_116770_c0_seq2:195-767(+)
MDWWQEEANDLIGLGLSLICLPAQHWANRWPWDRNETLWCGYGVIDERQKGATSFRIATQEAGTEDSNRRLMPFFFAGDTGYCPVFELIGRKFDVCLAAIPIGAYEPRCLLGAQHCDPAQAVQILADLRAERGLAIHWGTYPLTPEVPVQQLADLQTAQGKEGKLLAVRVGDSVPGRDGNVAELTRLVCR